MVDWGVWKGVRESRVAEGGVLGKETVGTGSERNPSGSEPAWLAKHDERARVKHERDLGGEWCRGVRTPHTST